MAARTLALGPPRFDGFHAGFGPGDPIRFVGAASGLALLADAFAEVSAAIRFTGAASYPSFLA
ncbi:MAG: hypothetical protein ICV73_05005 [Acetobacteraceae bacterium]|nr:hypothetical protein [Acetobacteraceae bacterium]